MSEFTKAQIAELKEIIKSCLNESSKEIEDKSTDKSFAEKVQRQVLRCELQQKMFVAEEEDIEEFKSLEFRLSNCQSTVSDPEFQTMIDCFDFQRCFSTADKLDYMYRGHPITIKGLVEDALEMYDDLKDVENGFRQIGRLVLSKITYEDGPVYYMHFTIESISTYE